MLDHAFYVRIGLEDINRGLDSLKISAEDSGNVLLRAIIHNIEDQLSMIDGKNEIHPDMRKD